MNRIPTPLIVVAILVGLIALLPLIFPYSLLQSRIEARLGKIVHGEVQIESINFAYTPQPVFMLKHVKIESATEAMIDRVTIPVSARNVFALGKALYGITLSGAVFSRQFALGLPQRLAPESGQRLRIDQLQLENAAITLEQGTVGPASGQLDFKPDGRLEKLTVQSPDHKLSLEIQPAEPESFSTVFSAKNWILPFGHPVEFEYITLVGKANRDTLHITDIRAGLYNGLLTGNAELNWRDRLVLDGQIFARNLRAEPLISVFSPVTRATGILAGEGRFHFEAARHAQLFENPRLQGRFTIQEGMLHNLDLITPLKSPSQQTLRHGGQTNFNLLNGTISVRDGIVNLNSLHLDSGKFSANGDATIRQGQLSGGAAATLNAGSIVVSNRVSLDGTLAAPELRSGGAWRPRSEDTEASQIGQ